MPRFRERKLHAMDLIGTFKADSSSTHVRNALGCIGALKDEGDSFWQEDSQQLERWHRGCNTLSDILNSLSEKREIEEEPLQTVMREFIEEFDHTTNRMHQMLYGISDDSDKTQDVRKVLTWLGLAFRVSINAILSTWIDDKTEHSVTTS